MMAESKLTKKTEQVLEEHAHLREFCGSLREFLKNPRPEIGEPGFHRWSSELSRRLVELHDLLFQHFRFEEQEGGGFEQIAVAHPEATPKLEELCDEHPAMLREVRELGAMTLQYSVGETPEDTGLRRRIGELLDVLARHDRDETALIQKLEYRDFGVGD